MDLKQALILILAGAAGTCGFSLLFRRRRFHVCHNDPSDIIENIHAQHNTSGFHCQENRNYL